MTKNKQTISFRESKERTEAFFNACWNGELAVLKTLVKSGFDVNLRYHKEVIEDSKLTGLMYAAIQGHDQIARFLVESGADVHIKSKLGNSVLGYAAPYGRTGIIELALKAGADANDTLTVGPGEFTILHQACHNGHVDTVKLLIKHGAKVTTQKASDSPLVAAADIGNVQITRELLKTKHDQALLDAALMRSSARGYEKVVGLLVREGANVNCADSWDMTPLMWAARNGRLTTTKFLLSLGADINKVRNDIFAEKNLTPIRLAIREGHLQIVQLLKDSGAMIRREDEAQIESLLRKPTLWVNQKKPKTK